MRSIQSGALGALDTETVRLHGDRLQVVVSQSCFSAVAMLGLSVARQVFVYWIAIWKLTVVARNTTRIVGPRFMPVHYDS